MELQSELSEKHGKEKQHWQKKEVELQNIVSRLSPSDTSVICVNFLAMSASLLTH